MRTTKKHVSTLHMVTKKHFKASVALCFGQNVPNKTLADIISQSTSNTACLLVCQYQERRCATKLEVMHDCGYDSKVQIWRQRFCCKCDLNVKQSIITVPHIKKVTSRALTVQCHKCHRNIIAKKQVKWRGLLAVGGR